METIAFYQSNGEKNLLVKKDIHDLGPVKNAEQETTIQIDDSKTYQTIDGFGASFTDSSAYLINQVIDKQNQKEVMEKLFDPKTGIGISVLRNPMGASDYARFIYSYDDVPENETDENLEHFTIEHDLEDILPLTKEAMKISPQVKLFASPWSAPGWMKTTQSMIGGKLKKDFYDAYARYFTKFIKAYEEKGVPVHAITIQNEALFVPPHYPGMEMLPKEQIDFIKNYMKPTFVKNNINTKILAYDHNWDEPEYPLEVLEALGNAVDGTAWHWYAAEPEAQSKVYDAFPDKEVHFTEGSGGEWVPPFEKAFSNTLRRGIQILRNHSKTFILWNMALDEKNGPTVPGFGRSTCRGLLKVNQQTKDVEYTLDYYALGHFSKFIRPNAIRIESTDNEIIRTVAFKNEDNSIAAVIFNDSDTAHDVTLAIKNEKVISFNAPAKSAATVVLKDNKEI